MDTATKEVHLHIQQQKELHFQNGLYRGEVEKNFCDIDPLRHLYLSEWQ